MSVREAMFKNIIKKIFIIFMLLFFASVASATDYRTNNGYLVKIPNRIVDDRPLFLPDTILKNGEAINYILQTVDMRVDEWIKSHPNYGTSYLKNIAKSLSIKIFNDWAFPCNASNAPYGLCVGQYKPSINSIYVSLYSRIKAEELPINIFIPPWIIRSGRDVYEWTGIEAWLGYRNWYYYGYGDPLLAVIPHELDHAIGINND